jgi:hypothetical protein
VRRLRQTRSGDLGERLENPFSRFTFPAALGLLCGVTVVGILIAFELHVPQDSWLVTPILLVLGALFLLDYSKRPGPESQVPPGTRPMDASPGDPASPGSDGTSAPSDGASAPGVPGSGAGEEAEGDAFLDPVEEADRAEAEKREQASPADEAAPPAPAPPSAESGGDDPPSGEPSNPESPTP